jgi:tetratricopeptide (TPR) repeat protein
MITSPPTQLVARAAPPRRATRPWALLIAAALVATSAGCGPDPDRALEKAQAALEAGDEGAAQEAFRRALDRHPDHAELLLFAAGFYLREEAPDHYKPRLALHYAHRAAEAIPGSPEAATVEIRALLAMGQTEDARLRWELATEQHPEDAGLALSGELF